MNKYTTYEAKACEYIRSPDPNKPTWTLALNWNGQRRGEPTVIPIATVIILNAITRPWEYESSWFPERVMAKPPAAAIPD
jgi:hypothetical protein